MVETFCDGKVRVRLTDAEAIENLALRVDGLVLRFEDIEAAVDDVLITLERHGDSMDDLQTRLDKYNLE